MSIVPLVCLLTFPLFIFRFPVHVIFRLELLGMLTVGVLFAFFFLGISIYGFITDKRRRRLYISTIVLMTVWLLWSVISWTYIENMDYLLH